MDGTTYTTQRLIYHDGRHAGFVVVDYGRRLVMMPGDGIFGGSAPFAFDRLHDAILHALGGGEFSGGIEFGNALIGSTFELQDF